MGVHCWLVNSRSCGLELSERSRVNPSMHLHGPNSSSGACSASSGHATDTNIVNEALSSSAEYMYGVPGGSNKFNSGRPTVFCASTVAREAILARSMGKSVPGPGLITTAALQTPADCTTTHKHKVARCHQHSLQQR